MLSLVRGSNLDGDIGVAGDLAIHGDGFVFDSVEKALCVYIRLLPLRNIGIFINPLCYSIRGALTRTRQAKTQQNEQHDDGRFHIGLHANGITVLERYVAPTLAPPVAFTQRVLPQSQSMLNSVRLAGRLGGTTQEFDLEEVS